MSFASFVELAADAIGECPAKRKASTTTAYCRKRGFSASPCNDSGGALPTAAEAAAVQRTLIQEEGGGTLPPSTRCSSAAFSNAFRRFWMFITLRLMFQPVVESVFLRDRARFVGERLEREADVGAGVGEVGVHEESGWRDAWSQMLADRRRGCRGSVAVVPVFDAVLSPRTYAVVAVRHRVAAKDVGDSPAELTANRGASCR